MKGVIVFNPSFLNDGMKNQIESLKREFEFLGVDVKAVSSNAFYVKTVGGKIATDLGEADFIVFLNKDTTMAHFLEKSGYKLFNSAKSIEICDDKALTYAYLAKGACRL